MNQHRRLTLSQVETLLQRTIARNDENFKKWMTANGHEEPDGQGSEQTEGGPSLVRGVDGVDDKAVQC